jgi:protein gp37
MTGIEWTDTTWNPVTGCDRISTGCDHCYALALAKRLKAMGSAKYQNDGDPRTSGPGFAVTIHPGALDVPRRWAAPRRVFVNSMSDLFHARVPAEFVRAVVEVIADTPQHTYQVLTKRPGRARRMVEQGLALPPNLWLGTSVENGAAGHRITDLINTAAAVRFLSCEPLLGPIDLDRFLFPVGCPAGCRCRWPEDPDRFECGCRGCEDWRPVPAIDWVIVGGESGPGARPVDPEWVRDLRDQCVDGNVAFFFKQWGGRTPKAAGRELDGEIWSQYPQTRSTACPA